MSAKLILSNKLTVLKQYVIGKSHEKGLITKDAYTFKFEVKTGFVFQRFVFQHISNNTF